MNKEKVRKGFNGVIKSHLQLCDSNAVVREARKHQEVHQDTHDKWQRELSISMGDELKIVIEYKEELYNVTKETIKSTKVTLDKILIDVSV